MAARVVKKPVKKPPVRVAPARPVMPAASPMPQFGSYVPPADNQGVRPFNLSYDLSDDQARANLRDLESQSTQRQSQLNNQYGFGDSSNPFSRLALLQQNFNRSKSATMNRYAERGLLSSGVSGSMQQYNAGNFAQGYDSLQRDYQGRTNSLSQGLASARARLGQQLQRSALARTQDASSQLPSTPSYTPDSGGVDWAGLARLKAQGIDLNRPARPAPKPKARRR